MRGLMSRTKESIAGSTSPEARNRMPRPGDPSLDGRGMLPVGAGRLCRVRSSDLVVLVFDEGIEDGGNVTVRFTLVEAA